MADNSTTDADTQDTFLEEAATYMTYKVAKYIATYWFPVLIPLGLVGNTLSFLVMIRPNNRKVSTCMYMAAISINDNLMLCVEVHAWFVDALKLHEWYQLEYKIIVYFSSFALQSATYLILAMTVDKYIAIRWPHKAAIYSSPKRAKTIIVTILIFVSMYNVPHLFMTAVVKGKCYGYSTKSILTKVYSWLDFVLNGVIPFTLLIHMNYVIVKTVRNSQKMFTSDVGTMGNETREKTMKSAASQLTTMLLAITTLFLILLFPTYVRFIYTAFVSSDTPSKFAASIFISEVSNKLYVTNSGINFFLYCVSGKKFRNDLKEIVCRSRSTNSPTAVTRADINNQGCARFAEISSELTKTWSSGATEF